MFCSTKFCNFIGVKLGFGTLFSLVSITISGFAIFICSFAQDKSGMIFPDKFIFTGIVIFSDFLYIPSPSWSALLFQEAQVGAQEYVQELSLSATF